MRFLRIVLVSMLFLGGCTRDNSAPGDDSAATDGSQEATTVLDLASDGTTNDWAGEGPGDGATTDGDAGDGGGSCTPGSSQACTTSSPGICSVGTQDCSSEGGWGPCSATIKPGDQAEACGNSLDDDCDGTIDAQDADCQSCSPGTTQACTTTSPGVCADGIQDCTLQEGGSVWKWDTCQLTIQPGSQPEACANSLDDDCDGATDTDDTDCQNCTPTTTQACTTSYPGVCADGTQTCTLETVTGIWGWGSCAATIQPGSQTESCTGALDDDCDGLTDSNDTDCQQCTPSSTQSCTTSYPGVCSVGTETCTLNSGTGIWGWGSCVANILPGTQAENCSNSLDDDCDGQTDSGDSDCCVPQYTKQCFDNDEYWYDSCGVMGVKATECGTSSCNAWSGWSCSGSNRVRTQTCYTRGCASNACFVTTYTNTESVSCSCGCSGGSCNPTGTWSYAVTYPTVAQTLAWCQAQGPCIYCSLPSCGYGCCGSCCPNQTKASYEDYGSMSSGYLCQ